MALIFVSFLFASCQKAKEPEGKKEVQAQKEGVKQKPSEAKPEVRPEQKEQKPFTPEIKVEKKEESIETKANLPETKEEKKGELQETKPKKEFLESLRNMQIAYVADGDIWVMRGDGSDKKRVTKREDVTILFGWSYDDTRLLFGTGKLEFDPVGNIISGYNLWILEVKTKKMILVMNGDQILKTEWSPNEATFFVEKLDESLWLLNEIFVS